MPVTDAEVADTEAEPRETPPMDPAEWSRLKAEQDAHVEAQRPARAEAAARAYPVTDAELEKYGQPPEPEPEAELGAEADESAGVVTPGRQDVPSPAQATTEDEIRADLGRIGRQVDELAARMDEQQARRDEINREIRDEPGIRPEPEPASWSPRGRSARTSSTHRPRRRRSRPTSRWRSASPLRHRRLPGLRTSSGAISTRRLACINQAVTSSVLVYW